MLSKKLSAALVACLLLGSVSMIGCITAPVVPPLGLIYSGVDAPLSIQGGQTGSKRGVAQVTSILGLVAWGDGSIRAAARQGNITEVKLVDYEFKNVLFGIYQRYTTVAYGD